MIYIGIIVRILMGLGCPRSLWAGGRGGLAVGREIGSLGSRAGRWTGSSRLGCGCGLLLLCCIVVGLVSVPSIHSAGTRQQRI